MLADVVNLFTPREEFHAIEGFTPAKASFITEEEIDQLLLRGGSYEDSKFGIYSYFVQGHNTQECAKFLREAYGEGGFACIGYNESHGSKGIKFTREAHPDSILLNQVGDFFELYGEDAKTAAALLGLTLFTRPIGGVGRVNMCGFPTHALDESVEKLRASHDVTVVPTDRQPHTMRSLPDGADDAKITVPNYNATVTAEEAPLLERFMADAGISAARFDHENGEVTFSFSAADRDAVENLIAKLRAELTKAVSATYAASTPKKPGRSRPELNYRALAKLFPEVVSGEYRYLHLEAGESMMPLHLEWTGADELSISHTYIHNGDLMRDPEMTFRVDRDKGTLEPLTFQQDGSIQVYQQVYPEPGRWVPKLRSDLNHFAQDLSSCTAA